MNPPALRRSLRPFDLVLAQVLIVVGTNWMGSAAALGSAGLPLWLAALAIFHLPLAAVVIYLTRTHPEEGGILIWARRAYGERASFLVGFNFWTFVMVFTSALGLSAGTALSYALAPIVPGLAEEAWFLAVVTVAVVGGFTALALAGLDVGKWFHNAGGALTLALALLLGGLVVVGLASGRGAAVPAPELPPLTLASSSLFLRMAVYALAGLECLAILAGETDQPGRNLPRSVALAAPLIGTIYMLGTAAVLLWVPPGEIDLVNPVAQVLARALGGGATAAWGSLIILLLLLRDLAQSSQAFTANSRLPMVAGWTHLLPAWLGELDHRGIPRRAVLVAGAMSLASGLSGLAGASRAEAFQILLSAAGLLFGLTYLVLFSFPLWGWRAFGDKPRPVVRAAGVLGLLTTYCFLVLSLVPVIAVPDPGLFAAKVGGVVLVVNLVALALDRSRSAIRTAHQTQ